MALAGELAKYVGGELTKTAGKEVAKAGAKSALANLIADTGTKAVAKATEKSILNGLVPSSARKLASGVELGSEAIPLFRGQTNRLDRLDYNKGLSPNSNGFFMTPNKGATDSWAGKGVVSVNADPNDIMTLDELRSLKKSAERYFRDPKYQMELYNNNPTQAEIYDALEAGDSYQELSRLTGKPFIERDGGQGTELGEVVFFPDTKPELTGRYNADLASGKNQWLAPTEDVVASETAVPVGTKIKFNKDLSAGSVKERAENYLGGRMLDEKGKPITFYHSTPNEFSKFDDARLGENTGYDNTALGHFVTSDKDFSKRFIDINNTGKTGRTMELQANIQKPITHPYMAGYKYDDNELDKIVEDYLIATDNEEFLQTLREYAEEEGSTIYDEYMNMTIADSPFEVAGSDRQSLMDKGYDAVEIVEGPKSGLVEGAKSNEPVSSYAVFNGDNLRPVRHIPVEQDNYSPLYHQTSAKSLADFSLDKRKAIGSDYGMPEGIFLKDTNADIGLPGKNQLKLDAKMNNPITFENRQELARYMEKRNPEYKALVKELDEINETYDDYLMDYMAERGMNPDDYFDFDTAMNDVDKYIADKAREAREMISAQLKKDGYDGAIVNKDEGTRGRSIKSYIVLDKEQLRDNEVPVKIKKYLDNKK